MAFVQFQLRRGTLAEWQSANPVLAAGEIGVVLDTKQFKIGDGTTAFSGLSYAGLKGEDGKSGMFREYQNKLQWRLGEDESWQDLISLDNPVYQEHFGIDEEGRLFILTDEEPTENSQKFLTSGKMWEYEQANPRGGSVGSVPAFTAAAYPVDQAFRQIAVRGRTAYICMSTGDNNRILRSDDGKFFYPAGQTTSIVCYSAKVNELGTLIAIDRNNGVNSIKRSTDGGVTFSNVVSPTTLELTALACAGTRWVACSRIGTGNRAIHSVDDGQTWVPSVTHEDVVFNDICFFAGRFWAVSSDGTQRLAVSTDGGATFTGVTLPNRFFGKVAAFKNILVAINVGTGAQSRLVWTADLGATFSQTLLPADVDGDTTLSVQGGKQIGSYFYVCGGNGLVARSLDLLDWEVVDVGLTHTFVDIEGIVIDGKLHIMLISSNGTGNRILTTVV